MSAPHRFHAAWDADEKHLADLARQDAETEVAKVQRLDLEAAQCRYRLLSIIDILTAGNLEEILERGSGKSPAAKR